jgi:hypothetical protein
VVSFGICHGSVSLDKLPISLRILNVEHQFDCLFTSSLEEFVSLPKICEIFYFVRKSKRLRFSCDNPFCYEAGNVSVLLSSSGIAECTLLGVDGSYAVPMTARSSVVGHTVRTRIARTNCCFGLLLTTERELQS